MSNIAVYDPSDTDVPHRVTAYHKSVNTPDYDAEPNKLVNPAVPAGSWRHWKHSAGSLVEMSQAEKDIVDRPEIFPSNFEIKTYANNRLQTVEWFATDNGDDTYSDLASRETYTWSGSKLISVLRETFKSDGSISESWTDTYFANGSAQIKKVALTP